MTGIAAKRGEGKESCTVEGIAAMLEGEWGMGRGGEKIDITAK